MPLATFDEIDLGAADGARQKPRYRELLVGRGLAAEPGDRAFVTFNGRQIEPHELAAYLQRLRAVRINMEFNSALCRGLLGSRYREIDGSGAEPESFGCGSGCGDSCSKRIVPRPPAADIGFGVPA
jgi:hypothetical protein